MLQPRLRASLRALEGVFASSTVQSSTQSYRSQSRIFQQPLTLNPAFSPSAFSQQRSSILSRFSQVRYASHASQGSGANKSSKNGAGRRLGAKKTGGQYVIPGNIIFRQRGSKWFPGENCGMGRDHTIYSLGSGYVQYYKDPSLHTERQYIGVVFEKDDKLPTPKNAVTRRRLGMVAVPRRDAAEIAALEAAAEESEQALQPAKLRIVTSNSVDGSNKTLRSNYMYRESNWEIGRAAEKAGISVMEWKRKDRWTAWRKKLEKIKRVAQMKELKSKRKTKVKARK